MAKHHRSINLSTKIALIEAFEAVKETNSKIAESFGLPKSTVSTILKNKVKLRRYMKAQSLILEGRGFVNHCDLEETLFTWFKQARIMNVPHSGPILKMKPKELAVKLVH